MLTKVFFVFFIIYFTKYQVIGIGDEDGNIQRKAKYRRVKENDNEQIGDSISNVASSSNTKGKEPITFNSLLSLDSNNPLLQTNYGTIFRYNNVPDNEKVPIFHNQHINVPIYPDQNANTSNYSNINVRSSHLNKNDHPNYTHMTSDGNNKNNPRYSNVHHGSIRKVGLMTSDVKNQIDPSYTKSHMNIHIDTDVINFDGHPGFNWDARQETSDLHYRENNNTRIGDPSVPMTRNMDAEEIFSSQYSQPGFNLNTAQGLSNLHDHGDELDETSGTLKHSLFPNSQNEAEEFSDDFFNFDEIFENNEDFVVQCLNVDEPIENKEEENNILSIPAFPVDLKDHEFIRVNSTDYCRPCYRKLKWTSSSRKYRKSVRTKCKDCKKYMCRVCFQIEHNLDSLPARPTFSKPQNDIIIPEDVLRIHKYIKKFSDKYTNCYKCYHKYKTGTDKRKHRKVTRNKCVECGLFLCEKCYEDIHKQNIPSTE